MNNRERFLKVMHYEEIDHPPFWVEGIWEDTWERWYKEGYPKGVSYEDFFEVDKIKLEYAGLNTYLYPPVEEKILWENETELIKIDDFGRKIRDFKNQTSMPEWLEFPVKNKKDLDRVINEHFDLSRIEQRWPEDWARKLEKWKTPDRDYLIFLDGGCYYGTLRNLAGVEYASYLFFDAPELVDELFERMNIICLEGLKRVLPEIKIDYIGFGEDIAYKTSTLISPVMFRGFLLPRYKKITDLAKEYGCDITVYDSDGNINTFMGLYFESGISGFLPCEVAADMDPVALRKRYGKQIKMLGGIDKRQIAKGKEEIKREVMGKVPQLIEEGGYIPYIDHSVSADISLENFRYYIGLLKDIFGV